jgi:hypothetical protein
MSALARLLLSQPTESLDLVLSYFPRLMWAARLDSETRLLWAILAYQEVNHRLPDAAALRYWLDASTDVVIMRRRVLALEQLVEAETADDKLIGDLEMLINAGIAEARKTWFKDIAAEAARIADGNLTTDDNRIREQFGVGPDAGAAYFREKLLHDGGTVQKRDLEGDIHTNLPSISIGLDEALQNPHAGRLFTGFRNIDDSVLVGTDARYIGIVGVVNGGKSTFTRSLMYNFAQQGANVLYIPREQTCRRASEQFLWLHADAIGLGDELPSLFDWRARSNYVTDRQVQVRDEVFQDFAQRISITGSIDVVACSAMSDVLQHYETHKRRRAYNVVCIDYLAHLTLPANIKDDLKGHAQDFARFQALSQDENIICVTPLQANRAGFKEADEAEGAEWGVFQSTNAIEQYSAAAQGMDLVVGVWYRGWIKAQDRMRISPLKVRDGLHIANADLFVGANTRRVRDAAQERVDNFDKPDNPNYKDILCL